MPIVNKNKYAWILSITGLILLAVLIARSRREGRISYLSDRVMQSGQDSAEALRELDAYHEDRPRQFIEAIAVGRIQPLDPALQVQAIIMTATGISPVTLVRLASLLRTDQSMEVRSAVADVIATRGCPEDAFDRS